MKELDPVPDVSRPFAPPVEDAVVDLVKIAAEIGVL